MFVDPNQVNQYDKSLGRPKTNEYVMPKSVWVLLRSVTRKEKIKKIYGENSNRKEKL